MTLEELKYPIGKFEKPMIITNTVLSKWISDIEEFPADLKNEVTNLNEEQLDTQYRPDGWTLRQVVHHCADSHMNSLIRFKLALTEDCPVIKPYFEERWAELPDSKAMPIAAAIKMLEGIHDRWSKILINLNATELRKTFFHPQIGKQIQLDENIGFYAWHGKHHLAHITTLKKIKKW